MHLFVLQGLVKLVTSVADFYSSTLNKNETKLTFLKSDGPVSRGEEN